MMEDVTDDSCIHGMGPGQCSLCKGSGHGPDPTAVAAGLKAAAARAGRVALPPKRFGEEVDAAVEKLQATGAAITVSAVQRIIRDAGYESGRKPTTAAMRVRGLLV